MTDSKLIELLKDNGVEVNSINQININNFVNKIIHSINKEQYIKRNIKNIILYNNERYMSINTCKSILNRSKRTNAVKLLKDLAINNESMIDHINNIYKFNGNNIDVYITNNKRYYNKSDIAYVLQYRDKKINIIPGRYIKKYKELLPIENHYNISKNKLESLYIEEDGLIALLARSKKPSAIQFCKLFQINVKFTYKEQEIIIYLKKYYDQLNIKYTEQYKISKYLIDFYIHKYNIAIEVDENNHKYRNKEYEQQRELYLKNKLNCVFFRFNPDDPDYNLGDILGKIEHIRLNNNILLTMDCDKNDYDKDVIIAKEATKQRELELKMIEVKQQESNKHTELKIEEEKTKQAEIEIRIKQEKTKRKQMEIQMEIQLEELHIKRIELELELKLKQMDMSKNQPHDQPQYKEQTEAITNNTINNPPNNEEPIDIPQDKSVDKLLYKTIKDGKRNPITEKTMIEFAKKHISETKIKTDIIRYTDLKEAYMKWYNSKYYHIPINIRYIKVDFERFIFKRKANSLTDKIDNKLLRSIGWFYYKLI